MFNNYSEHSSLIYLTKTILQTHQIKKIEQTLWTNKNSEPACLVLKFGICWETFTSIAILVWERYSQGKGFSIGILLPLP